MGSRQSVRALVLDESNRVLLVRFRDSERSWWCTPGGGVERGESDEAALARELLEELGPAAIEIGPWIWKRRHIGVFRGRPFDQSERIYLVRVAAFEARPSQVLREHAPEDIRWWSINELLAADDDFAPRRLPRLIQSIVRQGPPSAPVDVGV